MQDKYVCKHCRKTIDHVLYIENGKLNFPGGNDGMKEATELEAHILLCPECNEKLTYTDLREAGVLE